MWLVGFEDALKLYSSDEDPFVLAVIECLSHEFWPGPLTLVARASSRVFPEVTANTGFVSVRYVFFIHVFYDNASQ